jgi:hypothetical protein
MPVAFPVWATTRTVHSTVKASLKKVSGPSVTDITNHIFPETVKLLHLYGMHTRSKSATYAFCTGAPVTDVARSSLGPPLYWHAGWM